MILIPDNATLRQFIPNTFSTLQNQATLFDKIEPMLTEAEIWLTEHLIPEHLLIEVVDSAVSQSDPLYFLPRRIVALMAWRSAIPSLDVLITANGISVTENNTLKPAAKAKIDRLLSSVTTSIDATLKTLIRLLPEIPGWKDTDQAASFRQTLFPSLRYLSMLGIFSDLWNWHEAVTPQIKAIEDRIADDFISQELMDALRFEAQNGCNEHVRIRMIDSLRSIVLKVLRPALPKMPSPPAVSLDVTPSAWSQIPEIDTVMAMLHHHHHDFPEFCGTLQECRLSLKPFKNRQDSGAFFF